MSAENYNGSKKWMLIMRFLFFLLGIIQLGLAGWAKFISNEVILGKVEMASQKSDIIHVKEDVAYIRERIDSVFELKKR